MKKNEKEIKEIFVGKKYRLTNKGCSFCLTNLNSGKMHFLQFSTKDPWLTPRSGLICNNTIKIYGWLFCYVGYSVE